MERNPTLIENRSQNNPPPGRFLPWFVAFEVTLVAGAIWMWWT